MKLFPGFYYCIDTSALIDLNESYPQDIFPTIWKNLEKIIYQGRLIAPKEVYKELEKIEDKLLNWAKKHKVIFKNLNLQQISLVKNNILKNFPKLVDQFKQGPQADPFIIGLAITESCSIITSERSGPSYRPRIPDVARHYGIKCLSLIDFFREQKWKY